MKLFLALFKCAENSPAHEVWKKLSANEKSARMESGAKAQEAWQTKYAHLISYDGGPLNEETKWVDLNGAKDIPSQMGSFMVVKANSLSEASEMFLNHPHFAFFPGDAVEVVECKSRHEV